MEPPNNYFHIPSNIILFFFVFCFISAEAAFLPKIPTLTDVISSAKNYEPSLAPTKPSLPPANLPSAQPSSNPKPRVRKINFPPFAQPAVAFTRPQNSAPTDNSPSVSYFTSFFPGRPFGRSLKTSLRRNFFLHSNLPNSASSPLPSTVDPSVKQLCDSTDYPEVCITSVLPFLTAQGETSVDPLTLLEMMIKACSRQADLSLAAASSMQTGQDIPHRRAMAIVDCKELYSDDLDGLQNALDAIPSKDHRTINIMISGVISNSKTCENSFGGKSPLSEYDETLHKIGSNCLAIASLVHW